MLFFPAFNCYNQLTFTRFCAASPSFRAWQVQYGLENPTTFYINMSFQLFAKLMFHEELAVFTRFAPFGATRLYICEQLLRDPFRLDRHPRFPARIALLRRLLCSAVRDIIRKSRTALLDKLPRFLCESGRTKTAGQITTCFYFAFFATLRRFLRFNAQGAYSIAQRADFARFVATRAIYTRHVHFSRYSKATSHVIYILFY